MHPLSVLQIHHISWNQVCSNIFLEFSRHWDLVAMSVPRVQLLPEDFVQLHPPGPNGVNSHSSFGPRFESQQIFANSTCKVTAWHELQPQTRLNTSGLIQLYRFDSYEKMLEDLTSFCQVDLHEDPRKKKEKKGGMQLIVGNHPSREVISTGFVGYSFVARLHTTFRLQFPLSFHLKQFDLRSPHLKQREAQTVWEVLQSEKLCCFLVASNSIISKSLNKGPPFSSQTHAVNLSKLRSVPQHEDFDFHSEVVQHLKPIDIEAPHKELAGSMPRNHTSMTNILHIIIS